MCIQFSGGGGGVKRMTAALSVKVVYKTSLTVHDTVNNLLCIIMR